MRYFGALLMVLVLFSATMQAQEATETPAPAIVWTCPEGFAGQTLNVYNWATYIGETTIEDFERLCDVTVNYDVYDNNEALIARLRQGNPGYDIAFPTEYAIIIMEREGLLQEINLENIPNLANIGETWLGLDYDPENLYSVPYLWGSFGVAYNTERVQGPITSWEQVWNHDGPVAWMDDTRNMFSVALTMLGYDPNSTDADEIAAARDYLLEHSGNVVTFAPDDGQTLLERGEVDIALEYDGDMYQLITGCECDTYAYNIPLEGAPSNISSLVIPTGAQNPALAEVFIDYMLDPVVGAGIVNYVAYPTPNEAALESGAINTAILSALNAVLNEEAVARLFLLRDVADAEQLYNDAWDELRIFAGQ